MSEFVGAYPSPRVEDEEEKESSFSKGSLSEEVG